MAQIKKVGMVLLAIFFTGGLLTSCKEDVSFERLAEDNYATQQETIGYVVGDNRKISKSSVELLPAGSASFSLTNDADKDVRAAFAIDKALLQFYNAANDGL